MRQFIAVIESMAYISFKARPLNEFTVFIKVNTHIIMWVKLFLHFTLTPVLIRDGVK